VAIARANFRSTLAHFCSAQDASAIQHPLHGKHSAAKIGMEETVFWRHPFDFVATFIQILNA
jgi:hypothetical protein